MDAVVSNHMIFILIINNMVVINIFWMESQLCKRKMAAIIYFLIWCLIFIPAIKNIFVDIIPRLVSHLNSIPETRYEIKLVTGMYSKSELWHQFYRNQRIHQQILVDIQSIHVSKNLYLIAQVNISTSRNNSVSNQLLYQLYYEYCFKLFKY